MASRAQLLAIAVLAAAALLAIPGRAPAAEHFLGGTGNKLAQYYTGTNQMQMRLMLEGAKTLPLADGRIQVTDARLQTFTPKGEHEMLVQAPQCFYDPHRDTLNSSGPIRIEFADGKIVLEGEGFDWRQTNWVLVISNDVRTLIQPELVGSSADAPASGRGPIEIRSRQFEFATNSGVATWRDQVRVSGTNLALSSRVLEAVLPLAGKRGPAGESPKPQLQSVTATDNVHVNYLGIEAAGQQAVYTADAGRVRVTGQPSWRAQQREGSADELVLERTNGVMHANGHARFQTTAAGLGGRTPLNPAGAPGNRAASTNQVVTIESERYQLSTNAQDSTQFARFENQVRVVQRTGDEVEGTLNCGTLTAAFTGTNQLETMEAEREVILCQTNKQTHGQRMFAAGKAVYHAADGTVELTEVPAWRDGERQGEGERITLSQSPQKMVVSGHAHARLPGSELATRGPGTGLGRLPGALLPAQPGTAELRAPAPEAPSVVLTNVGPADVFCDRYELVSQDGAVQANFEGQVRIRYPDRDSTCTCGRIRLDLPEGGKHRHMIAEETVAFDLVDAHNHKLHGTGDKADYSYDVVEGTGPQNTAIPGSGTRTNEVMVLSGAPAVLTTGTGRLENKVIQLDLGSGRVATPGNYLIRAEVPTVRTNSLDLRFPEPRSHSPK